MGKIRLPNFLIIGSAKSATTWLVRCLRGHPQIFIPEKEIHYYSKFYSQKLNWYSKHFKGVKENQIIGENSNSYLPSDKAPKRIFKLLPEVLLIVILRNPTDRAYSEYCMYFEKGWVSEDIKLYLDPYIPKKEKNHSFLFDSLYARHLDRFFSYFKQSQIKIFIYDDLAKNAQKFLIDVFEFLKVDIPEMGFNINESVNTRRLKTRPAWLKSIFTFIEKFAQNIPASHFFFRRLSSISLIREIKESMSFLPIEYPSLSPELKSKLKDYFKPDIKKLEALIKRDLSDWYD